MLRSFHAASLIFLFLLLHVAIKCTYCDDWPQWRGPDRDGVWNESGIVTRFTADDLPTRWRAEIGSGYTGPTVADGRVYVMDLLKTDSKQFERVLCLDAESGTEIWKHQYECVYRIGYKAGPRASVTIEDGRAYSHGAMGQLICFDAASGKVIWKKDLDKTYSIQSRQRSGNRMPIWGMTCSPLIYEDLLILQVGAKDAGVIAFDKKTGEQVWSALDDRGQYSSPILIHQGDRDVVVCWTGDSVSGLSPQNGEVFWTIDWKPRNMPIGCASPLLHGNHVFCTSFYDGSMLIKLDPDSPVAEKVWHIVGESERETKALHSIISTPVWIDEHIYGVDSYGEFRCLEAKTGKRVWENLTAVPKARWSTIHFVRNHDHVWMFNERGELILAKLSPEGFEEISRAKIIEPTSDQLNRRGGVCWSHPAFAMKCVFVRNDKELICVDLSE